jgi:hypothetical protein
MGSDEALTTHSDIADVTLVLCPGAATHLTNPQGLGMAHLYLHLMGAHGLSAAFTLDSLYCSLRCSCVHAF